MSSFVRRTRSSGDLVMLKLTSGCYAIRFSSRGGVIWHVEVDPAEAARFAQDVAEMFPATTTLGDGAVDPDGAPGAQRTPL